LPTPAYAAGESLARVTSSARDISERVAVSMLRIGERILGLTAQLLEIRRDRKIRRGAGEVFVLDRLRRRDRLGSMLREYRLAA
jgi:hypothetical protein